jgi:hypothetical protein
MKANAMLLLAVCLFMVLSANSQVQAQWVENGTAVYIDGNAQLAPVVVSDGMGGAIFAWQDRRNATDYNIYAQRFNVSGFPMWGAGSVAICSEGSHQEEVWICSDCRNGAIITWVDYRSADENIYAQRISASGSVMWDTDGVPICALTGTQDAVQITADGAGGAIIVWHDWRSGDRDIYVQRVNSGGYPIWTYNGQAVCTIAATNQEWPQIVTDGAGGAIITWADNRNGNLDVYAQRIESDGTESWTTDGIVISTASSVQGNPQIAADGAGGAIITWQDFRTGNYDIYVQRVNSSGMPQWTADGVALCTAALAQSDPYIVSDGLGGGIVAWLDNRNGTTAEVYARRIDVFGTPQWTADGVALATGPGYRYDVRLAEDGSGGAIVSWQLVNIYAQRIDAGGNVQWTANGEPIVIAPGTQDNPLISSDGFGGAVIVYEDYRSGEVDIYASRIEHDGSLYYPAPSIYEVRDVPGDQGGYVYLSWNASREDVCEGDLLTHYTIWRAIDPAPALLMVETGAAMLVASPGDIPETPGQVIRRQMLGSEIYFWELVGTHDNYFQETYGNAVETLFDSTAVSTEYHYFQVVAHTDDPTVYWESEPDSGYSVDNLAPCPPMCLMGELSEAPDGLNITWTPNTEIDLDNYNVYRGTSPDFVPGPGNLLDSPCDTLYFDGGFMWCHYYKVSAIDVHGNESDFSLLGPEDVTGVEIPEVPAAHFLAQNFPNPFNPVTTIAFGLSRRAHVSLRIYDAVGRLVRELIDENRGAAFYEEVWDGRNDEGAAAASGVYFYQLRAGTFSETRKMILLR